MSRYGTYNPLVVDTNGDEMPQSIFQKVTDPAEVITILGTIKNFPETPEGLELGIVREIKSRSEIIISS